MQAFHFKQFTINHSKSAHKVGTDGVLLGAWTSLNHYPIDILDIGAGTGLVSLMMAQRSSAENIEAIEVDGEAYEECVENFENSQWNDRLFCYHGDIKAFADEPDLGYDLITCNPPFFQNDQSQSYSSRDQARKQVNLTYEELLTCVQKLLSKNGEFSTIIPYSDYKYFMQIGENCGLFPHQITHVKGHAEADFKRSLIQFSFQKNPLILDELVLEISRHNYTKAYKDLVKAFYLKV